MQGILNGTGQLVSYLLAAVKWVLMLALGIVLIVSIILGFVLGFLAVVAETGQGWARKWGTG